MFTRPNVFLNLNWDFCSVYVVCTSGISRDVTAEAHSSKFWSPAQYDKVTIPNKCEWRHNLQAYFASFLGSDIRVRRENFCLFLILRLLLCIVFDMIRAKLEMIFKIVSLFISVLFRLISIEAG